MIAIQPVDRWKRPAGVWTNGVQPIHLFRVGRSIKSKSSLQQQRTIGRMNREAVAGECRHTAGRTKVIRGINDAIDLQRYLLPLTLKRFQIAERQKIHSDGWFLARFFHL